MTKWAITYIRPGLGPRQDQRKLCLDAAARFRVIVAAEFIEPLGVGEARPARRLMMRYFAKGKYNDHLLIVARCDRLARRTRDRNRINEGLRRAGVQVVVADLVHEGMSLDALRLVQNLREQLAHPHRLGIVRPEKE